MSTTYSIRNGVAIVGVWIVFRQPLTDLGKGLINLTPQGRVASVAGGLTKGMTK